MVAILLAVLSVGDLKCPEPQAYVLKPGMKGDAPHVTTPICCLCHNFWGLSAAHTFRWSWHSHTVTTLAPEGKKFFNYLNKRNRIFLCKRSSQNIFKSTGPSDLSVTAFSSSDGSRINKQLSLDKHIPSPFDPDFLRSNLSQGHPQSEMAKTSVAQ